jgi:hypothetical protein
MNPKTRAKKLLEKLISLQGEIYSFKDHLEDKETRVSTERSKKKYSNASQLAFDSGFELDVAQMKMEDVIKLL